MADIKIGQRLEERFDDVTAVKKGTSSNNSNPFKLTDLVLVEDTTESDKTLSSQVGLASDFMRDILAEIDLAFIGSGTAEDPYLVDTPFKLDMVRRDLSAYYKLTESIDLSTYQGATLYWLPIGNDFNPFSGNFDGNGKTISGLVTNGYKNAGLFHSISNTGKVSNLIVENSIINSCDATGQQHAAGIIASVCAGEISNCVVSGTVGMTSGVLSGGLVGQLSSGAIINQCKSTAEVNGNSAAGGLIGIGDVSCTISKCIAMGAVHGDNTNGGLIGQLNGATITNSYATGAVEAGINSGGLIGTILGDESETVTACYSKGAVAGSGSTHNGFIGSDSYESELIDLTYCYWDVTTSGQATTPNVKAIGKSTADMTTNAETTFADWSASIWNIANGSYPSLKWEDA